MIKRTRFAKSRQIAEALRDELVKVSLRRGAPIASARELADLYGVSLPTAHNALNMLKKEGYFYRIQGSGTFLNRDLDAQRLRIGIADQSVSFLLPPESNRVLNSHFEKAAEYFKGRGCAVQMISYNELLSGTQLEQLDGLLVSCMFIDSNSLSVLRKYRLPFVVYRYDYSEIENSCTRMEYGLCHGMRAALKSLSMTINDHAIILHEPTPSGNAAGTLWKKLLCEQGMPDNRVEIVTVPVEQREIICYRSVRMAPRQFHGAFIFVCNDEIAHNICNALALENFRSGFDYHLVSVGHQESFSKTFLEHHDLALVEKPISQMSQEAAKLLLHKIENHSDLDYTGLIPTNFMIIGESSRRSCKFREPSSSLECNGT